MGTIISLFFTYLIIEIVADYFTQSGEKSEYDNMI